MNKIFAIFLFLSILGIILIISILIYLILSNKNLKN
jgi:hypothetical protein